MSLDDLRNDPAALFDRSGRVMLAVKGPDRAKFLHNLTTNDVKRLAVGCGCESFITSPQGKTLGYVSVLADEDAVLVRTDPGGLEHVLPHFEKYGIFDDVSWQEETANFFECHLIGPRAAELIGRLGATQPPEGDLRHVATRLADRAVRLVRESPTGRPGFTILGERADRAAVAEPLELFLGELGGRRLGAGDFEALRIEAGTPVFGKDVTVDNLPQEVGRDSMAINFVKGCYLGQETVARIDALGHVNRLLKGLVMVEDGPVSPIGGEVEVEGKSIGRITSAAWSPGWGRPVALAYIKLARAKTGDLVDVRNGEGTAPAVVHDTPMLPEAAR